MGVENCSGERRRREGVRILWVHHGWVYVNYTVMHKTGNCAMEKDGRKSSHSLAVG